MVVGWCRLLWRLLNVGRLSAQAIADIRRQKRNQPQPNHAAGITNFLPNPPAATHTLRVCCLPSKQLSSLGSIHIAPDIYTDWPYSLRDMLSWAFEPAEQGMLEELVARGRADAASWARATGVGELAAVAAAAERAEAAEIKGAGLLGLGQRRVILP
jgi:hypothetical protein